MKIQNVSGALREAVCCVLLALAVCVFPASGVEPTSATPAGEKIWDVADVSDREETRLEFPDLIRFRGDWYCAFREGEIHGNHPSGRARIISSSDGTSWESVGLMEWEGGDVRDPRLSVTPEGQLMVNTSIYFVSDEPRSGGGFYQLERGGTPATESEEEGVARQSVTWFSSDGKSWSSVYACPTGVNTWRWDVTWHAGMGYSVGYAGKDAKGTLYRTRDGKSWRVLLTEFFPGGRGTEAALAFGDDGTAYCLLRDGPTRATVGIGQPPYYRQWQWKDAQVDWQADDDVRPADEVLGTSLGGPKIIRLSDGRLLGAARIAGRVTLLRIEPEKGRLTKVVELDGTSYPGVVEHEGVIWVTYGVRDASGIFLAKVKP